MPDRRISQRPGEGIFPSPGLTYTLSPKADREQRRIPVIAPLFFRGSLKYPQKMIMIEKGAS
ncbi:hypothetical protein GCWU000341_01534 [Oribacterium sp. oral taxon 078 str. F0262]|nr:hypothetical protein GCWU000341_01534 [Oribacterium sp. oral taxon 078 str. F0262]